MAGFKKNKDIADVVALDPNVSYSWANLVVTAADDVYTGDPVNASGVAGASDFVGIALRPLKAGETQEIPIIGADAFANVFGVGIKLNLAGLQRPNYDSDGDEVTTPWTTGVVNAFKAKGFKFDTTVIPTDNNFGQ